MKRTPRVLFFLAFLAFLTAGLAEVRIRSVSETYLTKRDFTRVPEYFTGREFLGNQVVARTQTERAGLYFILELRESLEKLPGSCEVVIEVVRSDGPEAKRYRLSIPEETKGRREILLGITGEDWKSREIKPVAWRLEIRDETGKPIASRQITDSADSRTAVCWQLTQIVAISHGWLNQTRPWSATWVELTLIVLPPGSVIWNQS